MDPSSPWRFALLFRFRFPPSRPERLPERSWSSRSPIRISRRCRPAPAIRRRRAPRTRITFDAKGGEHPLDHRAELRLGRERDRVRRHDVLSDDGRQRTAPGSSSTRTAAYGSASSARANRATRCERQADLTFDVRLDCPTCPGGQKIDAQPHGLAVGPDGRTIWFTGKTAGTVGRIAPDGEGDDLPAEGSTASPSTSTPDRTGPCG